MCHEFFVTDVIYQVISKGLQEIFFLTNSSIFICSLGGVEDLLPKTDKIAG